VTWQVLTTGTGWADVEKLAEAERMPVSADLMTWVDNGPPRTARRVVAGVEVYEDQIASGYEVTYFVDESVPYAAIVRVRKI
jgi:hypothetical protein